MPITLPPDVVEKLTQLAADLGRDAADVAREAITQYVEYETWFAAEVQKGIDEADRGELIDHVDVALFIDRGLPAAVR